MKPLLLLDVDGVLCPFDYGVTPILRLNEEDPFPGYIYSYDARVWFSEANGNRVRRLMESFDIVWCTGWEHTANKVISPLHGFPEFPVIEVVPMMATIDLDKEVHWKQHSIEMYVEDRPYAFVDDEIHDHGEQYARNREIPTLWLRTACQTGLTDEHVDELEKFAGLCQNTADAAIS